MQHSDAQSTNPPTDTDPEAGDESEDGAGWQCPQIWEAIMEEAEGLAYDDLQSDSNATVMGVDSLQGPALSLHDEDANSPPHTLRSLALCTLGSPMDHMPPLEATVAGRMRINTSIYVCYKTHGSCNSR